MSRNSLVNIIVALVLLGVGAGGGALVYSQVIGGSGAPSQPISAPTLSLDSPTATPETASQTISGVAGISAALDQIATQVADPALASEDGYADVQAQIATLNAVANPATMVENTPAAEPTEEAAAPADATEEAAAAEDTTTGRTLFRIVPEESEVRFILDEVLRGVPTTVIARTSQVAGDIIVDFAQPTNSQVGTIRVNARTLLTDNEFRNRAIRGEILESARDEYEFSDFNPTSLEGMPETVTMGQPFTFQVVGNLTVRDITQPVTFEVTVTPVSESRLEGNARATVTRSAYNLVIPNVPGVADVSEEVALEIEFVAGAVES